MQAIFFILGNICQLCQKWFPSSSTLLKHRIHHHELDLTAPTSGEGDRLDGRLHVIRSNPQRKTKDCMVCSNVCGMGRKRTTYYCDTCESKPGLHMGDCFELYHTKQVYK